MASHINNVVLSLLFLTAVFFVSGEAVSCFSGYLYLSSTWIPSYSSNCSGSNCYHAFSGYYQYTFGCTDACGSNLGVSCSLCNTDFCNTLTPSSISCYSGYSYSYYGSVVSTQVVVSCPTVFTTCFSTFSGPFVSIGCGRCNSSDPSCVVCNTSNCNSPTPSVISCYNRSASLTTYSGPGDKRSCHRALSTCSSYTTETGTFADCGSCSTETNQSCVTCSTSYCNTLYPSSISCYYRAGIFVFTSPYSYQTGAIGVVTPCSTGVTTCYSYTIASTEGFYNSYAGCGVCNSAALRSGCKTCNTVNCNIVDVSSLGTTTRGSGSCSQWRSSNLIAGAAAAFLMLAVMKLL